MLLIVPAVLILVIVGWVSVWSNHFDSGFHFDDGPVIVGNESLQHLSSIPGFFVNPRISSLEKDSTAYRPLLSSWFAIDYRLGEGKPYIFQAENFVWFTALLLVMFALFRVFPGVSNIAAAFVTLLFGLHPVTADTVDYALRRGVIMGSFGVICGMLIWIVWPWRLPQTLPLTVKRVPQDGWDAFVITHFERLESLYMRIIHAPVGLYLWPVVPALLCEPAAAVFAPILVVYVLLFETKRSLRHAIPAVAICGGYWFFQLVFTWKLGEFSRMPAANYWFTQPWVALRYLSKFFVPRHLSADSDFTPFAHIWDPLAIAGFLGIGSLMALAIIAGRYSRWRTAAFGIWWFLLAQLPDAATPHRAVEADWRMFLPFVGLALSVASMVSMALEKLEKSPARLTLSIASGTVALGLAGVLGWATFERNAVWESEATLWSDVMARSPHNGRAFMNYGLTRLEHDPAEAFDYFRRAAVISAGDPVIEINLALAYGRFSQPVEAESQFRHATSDGPSYSPAYSAYGQWMLAQDRASEALQMASRALALDPYDLVGRRTLMDVMAQRHQWSKLAQFARETLRLFPDDPDGQRSLLVAQTGLDQVDKAEEDVKAQPSVDGYLALSVLYFQSERYEDCINSAREVLKINPKQAEAYANLAAAYHSMGKLEDTILALREEVRLNPDLPSARSNLEIELTAKGLQSEQHLKSGQ